MTNNNDDAEREKVRQYHRNYYRLRCAADPTYKKQLRDKRREKERARRALQAGYGSISPEKRAMIEARKSNRLTRKENFQISEVLRQHGQKEGEMWVYAPDWDDARVAKETGFSHSAVKGVRRDYGGRIIQPRLPRGMVMDDGVLTKLQDGFLLLDSTVAALQATHQRQAVEITALQTKLAAEAAAKHAIIRAVDTLITATTSGRNAIDPRRLQELQNHLNSFK